MEDVARCEAAWMDPYEIESFQIYV